MNPYLTKQECIETVTQDLALISIELVSEDIAVTTRDVSISFEEKLGIVGIIYFLVNNSSVFTPSTSLNFKHLSDGSKKFGVFMQISKIPLYNNV